ncbi:hypothetical protein MKK84_29875 [Methylobacterium sp. E-065]|uniref:DUF6883 domain-containing protein n=1 Tax=Methylobacterium sp. E-065 TaxID=2836583 RepID=UPI001FB973F8|nr:DUF6883 domain-containing protein [Methylobacterium sp. E-065]MCJ2021575.1 hypothetical protein [Methylobacterium sp. E-065]
MTTDVAAVVWTVERPKIVGYLLNAAHTDGASKAKYLLALGYKVETPEQLADDLVSHAVAHWPGRRVLPAIGRARLIFEGPVQAPDGRCASLRSVWEETAPGQMRFLTAYPWKP